MCVPTNLSVCISLMTCSLPEQGFTPIWSLTWRKSNLPWLRSQKKARKLLKSGRPPSGMLFPQLKQWVGVVCWATFLFWYISSTQACARHGIKSVQALCLWTVISSSWKERKRLRTYNRRNFCTHLLSIGYFPVLRTKVGAKRLPYKGNCKDFIFWLP